MNTDSYNPNPVDTSDIALSEELLALAENMAANVHDVCAIWRMNEGWTFGTERNDELKTHPCLVPYSDLPESEKEYDRSTSIETLKFIICKGFEIKKHK